MPGFTVKTPAAGSLCGNEIFRDNDDGTGAACRRAR
jgi:hypothetical protein